MRAALQKLLDAGQPGPADLSAADLQPMAARLSSCADPAARASLLRGVGLLGCLRVRGQEQLGPADTELVQVRGGRERIARFELKQLGDGGMVECSRSCAKCHCGSNDSIFLTHSLLPRSETLG